MPEKEPNPIVDLTKTEPLTPDELKRFVDAFQRPYPLPKPVQKPGIRYPVYDELHREFIAPQRSLDLFKQKILQRQTSAQPDKRILYNIFQINPTLTHYIAFIGSSLDPNLEEQYYDRILNRWEQSAFPLLLQRVSSEFFDKTPLIHPVDVFNPQDPGKAYKSTDRNIVRISPNTLKAIYLALGLLGKDKRLYEDFNKILLNVIFHELTHTIYPAAIETKNPDDYIFKEHENFMRPFRMLTGNYKHRQEISLVPIANIDNEFSICYVIRRMQYDNEPLVYSRQILIPTENMNKAMQILKQGYTEAALTHAIYSNYVKKLQDTRQSIELRNKIDEIYNKTLNSAESLLTESYYNLEKQKTSLLTPEGKEALNRLVENNQWVVNFEEIIAIIGGTISAEQFLNKKPILNYQDFKKALADNIHIFSYSRPIEYLVLSRELQKEKSGLLEYLWSQFISLFARRNQLPQRQIG